MGTTQRRRHGTWGRYLLLARDLFSMLLVVAAIYVVCLYVCISWINVHLILSLIHVRTTAVVMNPVRAQATSHSLQIDSYHMLAHERLVQEKKKKVLEASFGRLPARTTGIGHPSQHRNPVSPATPGANEDGIHWPPVYGSPLACCRLLVRLCTTTWLYVLTVGVHASGRRQQSCSSWSRVSLTAPPSA